MLVGSLSLLFAYSACGMLLASRVAHPPTGAGFWRLVTLLVFASGGLGLGLRLGPFTSELPPLGTAAVVAWVTAAAALAGFGVRKGMFPGRKHIHWLTAATLAAAAAVLLDPVLVATGVSSRLAGGLYAAGLLTVSLALGSVLMAMILAHWYLVESRLPLPPLYRILLLLGATEVLKGALLLATVLFHWPQWRTGDGGILGALVLGDALFLAVRAILGVLAPLGLVWMTWKTVQIRSIQSATGILYAAVVFVLFGEIISVYLSVSTGQPY